MKRKSLLEAIGLGVFTAVNPLPAENWIVSTAPNLNWKGVASSYNLTVNGAVECNGAWTYHRPTPLARKIKGRVAFWERATVRRADNNT